MKLFTRKPGQRRNGVLLGIAAALFAATGGCGRSAMVSEVKPDGSLTRTVTLTTSAPEADKTNSDGSVTSSMGPKLDELFVIPKDPAWTVTRTKKKDETVITMTRTVPAGQVITNDLRLKDTSQKPDAASPTSPSATKPKAGAAPAKKPAAAPALLLTNTVTIKQIAPGRLEYREVIKWNGKKPKEFVVPDAQLLKALREALPASLASDDAALKKVAVSVQKDMWTLMFGPGDPLMTLALFHQDLFEFRLQQRLATVLDKSFTEAFGSRLSAADRAATVGKFVNTLSEEGVSKMKTSASAGAGGAPPPGEDSESDSSMPIAMFFRVKLPGKVVATNGETNLATGEVVWAMYSMAPAGGDITLTAECEVGK
jgi:hypothetical protein